MRLGGGLRCGRQGNQHCSYCEAEPIPTQIYLRYFHGRCVNPHGHNYRVCATLAGEDLEENGLLFDFKHLKEIIQPIVDSRDHQMINEIQPFTDLNPSAGHYGSMRPFDPSPLQEPSVGQSHFQPTGGAQKQMGKGRSVSALGMKVAGSTREVASVPTRDLTIAIFVKSFFLTRSEPETVRRGGRHA
jgi:hypothetical protein